MDDTALMRMGAMVRSLDLGAASVAEGGGFEAVLASARERLPDDDALIAKMNRVLASLSHISNPKRRAARLDTWMLHLRRQDADLRERRS